MIVAVGELFNKIGETSLISIEEKAKDNWNIRQIVEFISPVSIKGFVENKGNSFALKGDGEVTISISCDRCLKSVKNEVSFEIDEVFISANLENDVKEETETFSGDTIDISHIVKRNILSNLPMKCVCSEDCKGLCSMCGKELNHGDCNCDTHVIDPRFEVLSTLFNNDDEEV